MSGGSFTSRGLEEGCPLPPVELITVSWGQLSFIPGIHLRAAGFRLCPDRTQQERPGLFLTSESGLRWEDLYSSFDSSVANGVALAKSRLRSAPSVWWESIIFPLQRESEECKMMSTLLPRK